MFKNAFAFAFLCVVSSLSDYRRSFRGLSHSLSVIYINSYQKLLNNSKDTIEFDHESEDRIAQKRRELGADSALLRYKTFFIYKINIVAIL